MDKLVNIKDIKRYYCSQCKHFHIRKYKYKVNTFGVKTKTKDTPFFNHKEFACKLTNTEKFKKGIKGSFSKYSIKSHKKSIGSKIQ